MATAGGRRAGHGPLLFLAVARSLLEAVIVATLAAVLHSLTGGRDPLPFVAATLLCFGGALILVTLLRDTRTEAHNVRLTIGVVAGGVVLGMLQPTREIDGLALMTRVLGFGVLGEIFLWRTLSVARSITRWSDARTSTLICAFALVIAALLPAGIDAESLPVIALLCIAASGIALSLARSSEELDLAGRSARSVAGGRSAAGAAFVLGGVALLAAIFSPALRSLASDAGDVVGPLLAGLLYLIALPFGYLAALLVPLLQPLSDLLFRAGVRTQTAPERLREREMLEAMEQTRPFIFGAVELIFALVAVAFAIVLIERLTRERRSLLPEGATLEREHASGGASWRDTLAALRPRPGARRTRPRDDGSAAAAIRVLYWRFLQLADRAGAGWRATPETPSEHWARLRAMDERWRPALAIVEAFERVRYGEEDPTAATVRQARSALEEIASRRA